MVISDCLRFIVHIIVCIKQYNNIINSRKTKQKSLLLLSIILNNNRFDCRIITIKITLQTFSTGVEPLELMFSKIVRIFVTQCLNDFMYYIRIYLYTNGKCFRKKNYINYLDKIVTIVVLVFISSRRKESTLFSSQCSNVIATKFSLRNVMVIPVVCVVSVLQNAQHSNKSYVKNNPLKTLSSIAQFRTILYLRNICHTSCVIVRRTHNRSCSRCGISVSCQTVSILKYDNNNNNNNNNVVVDRQSQSRDVTFFLSRFVECSRFFAKSKNACTSWPTRARVKSLCVETSDGTVRGKKQSSTTAICLLNNVYEQYFVFRDDRFADFGVIIGHIMYYYHHRIVLGPDRELFVNTGRGQNDRYRFASDETTFLTGAGVRLRIYCNAQFKTNEKRTVFLYCCAVVVVSPRRRFSAVDVPGGAVVRGYIVCVGGGENYDIIYKELRHGSPVRTTGETRNRRRQCESPRYAQKTAQRRRVRLSRSGRRLRDEDAHARRRCLPHEMNRRSIIIITTIYSHRNSIIITLWSSNRSSIVLTRCHINIIIIIIVIGSVENAVGKSVPIKFPAGRPSGKTISGPTRRLQTATASILWYPDKSLDAKSSLRDETDEKNYWNTLSTDVARSLCKRVPKNHISSFVFRVIRPTAQL
ncbi:hypothetical protein AGLY_005341 [Aphis glycines]|uniref:Uncharacterized protein n=1 Tax=Aphis glycines TaxID=307491 RepID=A0A6G0TYR5_APHGL|nr:hypothetical protein AGLY_005341 [Aphis glycines]